MYIFNDRPLENRLSYGWSAFVMFHAHFSQIFHTISIWLTVTLAVWRYIAVRFPQRNRLWCDMKTAAAAITSAFVFSPILCIPSFLMFNLHRRKFVHSDESVTSVYVVGPSKMAQADDGILQLVNFWTYSVFIKIVPCVALMVLTYFLISTMYEVSSTIDYRRDDRKKLSSWGDRYHGVAEDSRIPKLPVMNPLQALVHPQRRKLKKTILHGLSSPNPNFSEFAFFGK
jgi:hypothetical protein